MGEHADKAWQREAFGHLERRLIMTDIETNVPAPSTEKKAAARGRKKKVAAKPSGADGLRSALEFIRPAQKAAGTNYQTHCIINNGWCVAFDEVLTIGCKIEEDISACPHTASLTAALSKCGETLAITQLNEGVLSVKSDRFKASINCVRLEDMPASAPDDPMIAATDDLKTALGLFAWLLIDNSSSAPWKSGVLLQSNTLVACNGVVILEYWHGIELPVSLLIPKDSAIAISKCPKQLVAIGGSENSVTFHFADQSFIKTQLLKDRYPNYGMIFDNVPDNVSPVPGGFFEAVSAVQDFSNDGFVCLKGNRVQSHMTDGVGASFDIEGIPDNYVFKAELLKGVQPYFHNTTFHDKRVKFMNGNVRGVLMGGANKT